MNIQVKYATLNAEGRSAPLVRCGEYCDMYEFLLIIFELVEKLGPSICIIAWITVSLSSVLMILPIRKKMTKRIFLLASIIGGISLVAHLGDYFITLHITPDLADEANPLWKIVLETYGLTLAKWYGLTGKIFLSILSFEFFAFYLISLKKLFPEGGLRFWGFLKKYGTTARKKINFGFIFNIFSFLFAMLGPFYIYVAYMNSILYTSLYDKLIPIPIAMILYIIIMIFLYFLNGFSSYAKRHS